LAEHGADLGALVRAAFAEALSRPPAEEELAASEQFFEKQTAAIDRAADASANDTLPQPLPAGIEPARAAAVVDFCHALLNSNELLYLD
jgi:hypothetical protein